MTGGQTPHVTASQQVGIYQELPTSQVTPLQPYDKWTFTTGYCLMTGRHLPRVTVITKRKPQTV